MYGINVWYKCMQVLACIQVLFNATTTATINYTILDLILLNADTEVSTDAIHTTYNISLQLTTYNMMNQQQH